MGRGGGPAEEPAAAAAVLGEVLTPAELADGLDLLDRVCADNAGAEERAIARDILREIRHLVSDVRSTVDDVLIGRQVPPIRPSLTLMKLQVLAPPGALDGVLRWVEAQAGTRGRRTQDFTLVTENGAWSQLLEHQPPLVYARRNRPA